MGAHTAHSVVVEPGRAGAEVGRVVLSLIGGGALVAGAFLDWTRDTIGTNLTYRGLYQIDFGTRSDIVQTVGGVAIVIGLLAVLGLVDRTGWLTRLAGALGVILFGLFAIEVYRSSQHDLQTGAWLALGGGVVLLLAGLLGPRTVAEMPAVVETRPTMDEDGVQAAPPVKVGRKVREAQQATQIADAAQSARRPIL